MKVTEAIAKARKPLFSFEILPPERGSSIQSIFNVIDNLMEFQPSFVSVTSHQAEKVYRKLDNGLYQVITLVKRPGTVAIAAAIQNKYKIDVIPHLICGGFSKEETEDALIDLHFLGIENILALRGDPPKGQNQFIPHPQGHKYAIDLVRQIMDMNRGKYLDPSIQNPEPTNFEVGVAGYPEKHAESPNMEFDLEYLKAKVEAGARFIITQMFFDNNKFFDFVQKARQLGINVPIIPGLKPITSVRQLTLLPKVFNVTIPKELTDEILKHKDDKSKVQEIGIQWAVEQSRELLRKGVPMIHYFTLGSGKAIREIVRQVF